ncbi:hypothetical protein EST38_g9879 [Candolleomyces aberdarensis]|uniref:Uncharacterized protein n=1 Tax=Candolleomyces aberdarensis TaxID=2316362 RepID=A0A4Q2DB74_9AGAR|nr:hypothetical protein EST38_g9879 [Candolleomyces aberdarensis]
MTEYDYSPAAWEAHIAKQASIAQWSQETSQQKHAYTNPFKPSAEETARKNASNFYGGGEVYEGPDRPPTPTNPGPIRGGFPGYVPPMASGQQQQAPAATAGAGGYQAYYYAGSVLVPRWTGTTWVYETHPNPNQAQASTATTTTTGAKSSSSSIKSSSSKKSKQRPTPVKSYTLPPSYVYQQQNPQYFQMPLPPQPNSGNTTASGGSGGAYASYAYPTVMVDGAMRKDSVKLTKKKKPSGDASSFFGRLGRS